MTDDSGSFNNEVKTYFKLKNLSKWLGLSQLEILINLISFLIFTILLTFKIEESHNVSVHHIFANESSINLFPQKAYKLENLELVFLPLFCSDILNCYFTAIVFIRMFLADKNRHSLNRILWSQQFLALNLVHKYLLYSKLSESQNFERFSYSEVFSPLFVLLQLIAIRACQLHRN